MVLTYLVIGVVVCWTPIMVYYTMTIVTGYENYLLFLLGNLLYYSNALLDPIFFAMAIAPLRVAVYGIVSLKSAESYRA